MSSHEYRFSASDALKVLAGAVLWVVIVAAGLHGALFVGLLPKARPALDMDTTVLLHQAEAACRKQDAELLLVGDSSCLMNVSAIDLGTQMRRPVLNLAMFSYLDLVSHGRLVKRYAETNPKRPIEVVLLLHPESLRLHDTSPFHSELLRRALASDAKEAPPLQSRGTRDWLALGVARERLVAPLVPTPLPGKFGARYGFNRDLWRHLTVSRGSAIDPHRFDRRTAQGTAEYRLAPRFESESRQFRELLSPNTRLIVGLTPIPVSFAQPDHASVCGQMLAKWNDWLQADRALTNLPLTLPEDQFATVTHLNERGRLAYTRILGAELERNAQPSRSR